MAITRAQQVKQMLQDGGRIGLQSGSRMQSGEAKESRRKSDFDASANRVAAATNIKSMQDALGTKDSPKTDTRDRLRDQRDRTIETIEDRNKEAKGPSILELLIPNRRNLFKRSLLIPGAKESITKQRLAYEKYLRDRGIDPSEELMDTDDLFRFFEKQAFDKNNPYYGLPDKSKAEEVLNYGDFLLKEFNNPTVKYAGDIGAYNREMGFERGDNAPVITAKNITEPTEPTDPNQTTDIFSGVAPRFAGSKFDFDALRRLLAEEQSAADGGRIGFFKGAVAGGEDISPGTDVKGNVRDDNPFTGRDEPNRTPIVNPVSANEPAVNPIFNTALKEPELKLQNFIKRLELENALEEDDEETMGGGVLSDTIRNVPKLKKRISAIDDAIKSADLGFALGGRIGAAEGGIMDLETGRQMYFLGKLVKKAKRAVKKIAKSPIGKAALAFGAYKLGGPKLGSFFGKGSLNPLKAMVSSEGFSGLGPSKFAQFLGRFGLADVSNMKLTGKGLLSLGGLTLGGLSLFDNQEDEDELDMGPELTMEQLRAIRNSPYRFTAPRFEGSRYKFDEGGDAKEPVAKKTMPLLDMGGKEMDLRDDGGFVPIGRMEKADDVPARLSKNEFVFTADAVRNAGDGDVDKGAEVMYNMMKNLESGGEVSEESQGLEGAREMFQTSKRLEEVL
jgi:hypothetical protein